MLMMNFSTRSPESMGEGSLIEYLSSESFVNASSNATRLVSKLKTSIERQELYETHQILRTIYFRFLNARDKVMPLCNLLYLGACYLIKSNENVSGQDIAMLFLETAAKCLQLQRNEGGEETKIHLTTSSVIYHSDKKTLDLDISQKVANLAVDLPDTEIGQSKFIAEALRILSSKLLNTSLLHEVVATGFWKKRNFASSRYHFLHCANEDNSVNLATMLVEYQTVCAFKSEADLFVTQFILQFLCLQIPKDPPKPQSLQQSKQTSVTPLTNQKTRSSIKIVGIKVLSEYTRRHLGVNSLIPSHSLPLLNFTYFIISIIDADQEAQSFKMLCDLYKIEWSRDPSFRSYLDRIGAIYFGLMDQSKPHQSGFLNNILLSLLEGTDEDEDSNQGGNNLSSCDELD